MPKNRQESGMIHCFYAKNSGSIREGVELDFRVPGTTPDHPRFRRSATVPNVRLPSVIVLIGPNGSGKTTLLRTMTSTASFMTRSFDYRSDEGILGFFAFGSRESRREPTRVEIDFDADWPFCDSDGRSALRYTLELLRDESGRGQASRVGYEALHAFPNGRPRRVFERRGEAPVQVAKDLGLRPGDDRLASIPPDASVIATLAKLGVAPFAAMARDIGAVQSNIAGPDPWRSPDDVAARTYQNVPEFVEKVSDVLPRLDLGIEEMKVYELSDGPALGFKHRGLDAPVPLLRESAGTRHLIRTFPILQFALEAGSLAVLDDFDVGFHADLAVEIIRWFQSEDRNPRGAQLVCSTHNLSLLDDLEKEEVFIAEKDRDGATRVYGVRHVAGVRRAENLQKLYRSGALGGTPTFG